MNKPTATHSPKTIKLPTGATLDELNIEIGQESDCCAEVQLGNSMKISILDGGGGKYIAIEGRWAMDGIKEIDELARLLKDAMAMSGSGQIEDETPDANSHS